MTSRHAVEHEDTVVWLLSQGANINKEDDYGETALSRAVLKGSLSLFKRFLDAGADVTLVSPLEKSLARRGEGNTNFGLTKELLQQGARVDKFPDGEPPIRAWAEFEQRPASQMVCGGLESNLPAVRLFLEYRADPSINKRLGRDEIPDTLALECSRYRGLTDTVAAIQDHLNRTGRKGDSHL